MKTTRLVAFFIVALAIAMNAAGGFLDSWRGNGGTFVLTQRHLWHDSMFLLGIGIFLLLL